MKEKRLWMVGVTALIAVPLAFSPMMASAETPAPTRAEALAALEHAQADLDTVREYIESTGATPTPSGSVSPSETTKPPTPTREPDPTFTIPPVPTSDAPTATTEPPAGRASGLAWSSGVNPQPQTSARVNAFATFRGAPVDNVTLFPPRDNWGTLSNPQWIDAGLPASFVPARDDLVMTLPLWPGNMSVGNTGTRAQWENMARVIAAEDPNAFVRLGWEMNLPGSYWNLNSGNRNQWVASYKTAVGYMKGVAPELRFVWNPNKGNDQTSGCTGSMNCSRGAFQEVKSLVYSYGIDSYDSWPPLNSDARQAEHVNGLLGESLSYAKANGKKFSVPEWGVACNVSGCQWAGNAGGDNPRYVTTYIKFFADNAADMAFDSYFDEPASYIRGALSVTPIGPNAPAAYRSAICERTSKC